MTDHWNNPIYNDSKYPFFCIKIPVCPSLFRNKTIKPYQGMKKISFLIIIVFTAVNISSGQTQDLPKKQYKATRINNPPSIDGVLDEDIWKTGTWIDDFTQNEPYNGQAATQRTEFNILFDDDNI